QATVSFGLSRPDLQEEFSDFLTDIHAAKNAAQ
ncbi:MAG: UTP--glucose-1-phosphate uridylyltransferase, partial [Rhodobacterales bacterium]